MKTCTHSVHIYWHVMLFFYLCNKIILFQFIHFFLFTSKQNFHNIPSYLHVAESLVLKWYNSLESFIKCMYHLVKMCFCIGAGKLEYQGWIKTSWNGSSGSHMKMTIFQIKRRMPTPASFLDLLLTHFFIRMRLKATNCLKISKVYRNISGLSDEDKMCEFLSNHKPPQNWDTMIFLEYFYFQNFPFSKAEKSNLFNMTLYDNLNLNIIVLCKQCIISRLGCLMI